MTNQTTHKVRINPRSETKHCQLKEIDQSTVKIKIVKKETDKRIRLIAFHTKVEDITILLNEGYRVYLNGTERQILKLMDGLMKNFNSLWMFAGQNNNDVVKNKVTLAIDLKQMFINSEALFDDTGVNFKDYFNAKS